MIYLDVTGACLLPLQSGIPRISRGIWHLLRDSGRDLTPIVWQPFRFGYTALSPRAQQLLENPLVDVASIKTPRDSTLPLLWAGFRDLRFLPPRVPLLRVMQSDDTLLITSIFPDNRLGYLKRVTASCPGKKIAIFHDAIPLHDKNVAAWERTRHLEALRLFANMDLVIAISESARGDLLSLWQSHKILPAPTKFLPWPVPFAAARPAFSSPVASRKILYVSRLKEVKNHATLFAACEKLWSAGDRFELELIGCEDEIRESRAIRREIESLQKRQRPISWRAHVSEEELHRTYLRARFTVFASLMEGFGMPVIESLWHGRPVICDSHDAVGELSGGGGCLTAEVRNADALAAAIRLLLENDERLLTLAHEAYARPVRTWTDYARDLVPLLDPR